MSLYSSFLMAISKYTLTLCFLIQFKAEYRIPQTYSVVTIPPKFTYRDRKIFSSKYPKKKNMPFKVQTREQMFVYKKKCPGDTFIALKQCYVSNDRKGQNILGIEKEDKRGQGF